MLTYIPYALLFFIIHGVDEGPTRNSYAATAFLKFHAICSMTAHTASLWLTVSVAMFRYIFLSARNGRELCSLFKIHVTIGVVIGISGLLNLPQIFVLKINEYTQSTTNLSWYYLSNDGLMSEERMKKYNQAMKTSQFVITATLVKIGPNILLILLSALLIRFMFQAQSRYQKMRQSNSTCSRKSSVHTAPGDKKRQGQTTQTTKLLVAIAIVFTVSELPQGISFVLSGLGKNYEEINWLLGNLFDLLTIISCGINFVLYCGMSQQFRKIFMRMLRIKSAHSALLRILCCQKSAPPSPQLSPPTSTSTVPAKAPSRSVSALSLDNMVTAENV